MESSKQKTKNTAMIKLSANVRPGNPCLEKWQQRFPGPLYPPSTVVEDREKMSMVIAEARPW